MSSEDYSNTIGIDNESIERVKASLRDRLSPKEYEIICRRFGLNGKTEESLESVASCLGVTSEYVRQLESKALRKLRARNDLPLIDFDAPKDLFEAIIDSKEKNRKEGLEGLKLSVHTYNCLRHAGINTIPDIINYPKNSWGAMKKLSTSDIEEINDKMRKAGYSFSIDL